MKQSIIISTVTAVVLSGCATQSVNTFQPFQAVDLTPKIQSGALQQKAHTLFVINDSSSSMSETYLGTGFSAQTGVSKLSIEKELLNRLNQTLPEMDLKAGLRSFGFGPCLDWQFTQSNQAVQPYSASQFGSAISSLACSSGGTPVTTALVEAPTDLASASGNIAMVVLSDGNNYASSPVPLAEQLKQQYGERLCIYTVWVGNEADKVGKQVLDEVAAVSGCGFSTSAELIASNAGMANFVEKVFFEPGTPAPVAALDSDGDGVIDALDRCPNTPKGAIVNKQGCWAFEGVLFDTNSSDIKSIYHPLFTNAIKVLNMNPGLTVEVQGHTDSRGSDAYNMALSQRRAESVKSELVSQGISGDRLTTKGFGESSPVAPNDTASGRAQNRRVVYKRTDI